MGSLLSSCCRSKRKKNRKSGRNKSEQGIPGVTATKMMLEAEAKGDVVIEGARQQYERKMAMAKKEAKKEIAVYQKRRSAEFDAFLAKEEEDKKAYEKQLREMTNRQMEEISREAKQNKGKALKLIWTAFYDIQPHPHRNLHRMRRHSVSVRFSNADSTHHTKRSTHRSENRSKGD